MKFLAIIRKKLKAITDAFERYPLTIVFLVASAVLISMQIKTDNDYFKYQLACLVGAALSIALQAAYERYFVKLTARLTLMGAGVVLTLVYYLFINSAPELSAEIGIKTSVVLFALLIAYMYVPVIKNTVSFNESFMATFKAFFQAAFFAGVLFAGCAIILGAIDTLIYDLDSKIYAHTANIVFVIFAPIFFLSLIPLYPGRVEQQTGKGAAETQHEAVDKAAQSPKFLEILISYIIIPLAVIFTGILAVYIAINIGGEFWTDNLLEPMLVSYAVGIILLTILSARMENKMTRLFRSIFPKVLIPIVVFQIAASILSTGDTGLTHTRYYVILFGLFAAASGVWLSLTSVRKTGIIAAMLIIFALGSVIPPVDAFSLSRTSQANRLESTLIKNGMLNGDTVTPNASVSDADKEKISNSLQYLFNMGYTQSIDYLPQDFSMYDDFENTFGFSAYYLPHDIDRQSVYVSLSPTVPLPVHGYDLMARTFVEWSGSVLGDNTDNVISKIEWEGKRFTLTRDILQERVDVVLMDEQGQELVRFDTSEIQSWLMGFATSRPDIAVEDATFLVENQTIGMSVIVMEANLNYAENQRYYYADFYVLIDFK